jgi:hypothetical protein
MNKILLIVFGSVLVACIAVSGWFYQTNRVALGFMSAHSSLLRDSFRKTEDGLRVERVLALYKDKSNQLATVRSNKSVALDVALIGGRIVNALDTFDAFNPKWCEVETVQDCLGYGAIVVIYAKLYDREANQSIFDRIDRYFTIDDVIGVIKNSIVESEDSAAKSMRIIMASQFELIQEEKITIEEVHAAMKWLKSEPEMQELIAEDLFGFYPHLIKSPEALEAVFDDADAYRAALALRDEYPQLTAFLYP